MASGAPTKKTIAIAGMMMLATAFVVAAEQDVDACIAQTSDVPGATNPCICSQDCACAGKCILSAGDDDDVSACFVDCVLKKDCGGCRYPSRRPSCSRSPWTNPCATHGRSTSKEKLAVTNIDPVHTERVEYEVYLAKIVNKHIQHHATSVTSYDKFRGRVDRTDIADVLSKIGAEADETIEVSLVPKYSGERITILSVKIEYTS
ncbi:hypothetical protein VPH35_025824 [Triticum aestivum]